MDTKTIIDTLVTDRTHVDVERVRELAGMKSAWAAAEIDNASGVSF